jgi:hypothetical protein
MIADGTLDAGDGDQFLIINGKKVIIFLKFYYK